MGWFPLFKLRKESFRIKPEIALKMIQNGSVILIDVRTQEEYHREHIPKAILMPVNEIEHHVQTRFPDLQSKYILYCRSGIRSKHAQDILNALGYQHVYDLGGIIDWPYETITNE